MLTSEWAMTIMRSGRIAVACTTTSWGITMAQRFLKIAVVYLFVGALLGITMGIFQNFALVPVHAHIGLLGWATLALAGVIYHLHPAAAKTRLARLRFWVSNLTLTGFMIGRGLYLSGPTAFH